MKSHASHTADAAEAAGGPPARALRYISEKLFYVSCFCQFALIFTISYEVISRGMFGVPTMWSFDISSYLMLFIIFLGVAYVFQINRYVRIDFLYDLLPRKGRRVIDIIAPLLSLVWIAILTWQSGKFAFRSLEVGTRSGTELEVPLGYIQIFIFIGSLLLLLQILLFIGTNIGALRKKNGSLNTAGKEIS